MLQEDKLTFHFTEKMTKLFHSSDKKNERFD